jgi:cytochrome P450
MSTSSASAPIPAHVPPDRVVDFDMFSPPGLDRMGVHEAWLELQKSTPHDVVWTTRNEGHWIVLRGKTIRAMYRDTTTFSNNVIFIPRTRGEKYSLLPIRLDPPEHTPYRTVLLNALGLGASKTTEPFVREVAASILDELAPRGQCNFTEDYAKIFPVRVFMAICNLPAEDAEANKVWIDGMVRHDGTMTMEEIMRRCFAYVDPVVEDRLANLGDDLISRVLKSDVDGREMTREEMRSIIGLLIAGGLDTVTSQLGFFMEFLAKNPSYTKRLVEDPKLIRKAVEEMLRLFPIVVDGRLVNKDTELDGVQLKEGDMISLPTVYGSYDEEINACPMHVDFERKKLSHMAFGEGPHICAGQHLARLELIVTIEEWLKRIPEFQVTEGERVQHKSGSIFLVENLPLSWTPPAAG